MVQIIGLIVAIYAMTRLIQAPIRDQANFGKASILTILTSVGAIAIIGLLTLLLLFADVSSH